MSTGTGTQMWRDELIDSYERLREIRALMRELSGLEPPDEIDDVRAHEHELLAIFRICQRVYGSHGPGYDFIPLLALRLQWFLADGELPEFVLRAYEIMREQGLSEALQRVYRESIEIGFQRSVAAVDEQTYQRRVGKLISSVFFQTRGRRCAL